MTHSNRFWAEYVCAVDPHAVKAFWAHVTHPLHPLNGETAAYRVLIGLAYSHVDACLAARNMCERYPNRIVASGAAEGTSNCGITRGSASRSRVGHSAHIDGG